MYLAAQTSPEWQNFGHAAARAIVLSGDALAASPAALVQSWAASYTSGSAPRNDALSDNSYQPMTTVIDDSPSRPDGTSALWIHFVRLQCVGGGPQSAAGATPMFEFDSPWGRVSVDLSGGNSARRCRAFAGGNASLNVTNVLPGLSLAALQGALPRVRVAFTDVVSGRQVVHVAVVTLKSRNHYASPEIVFESDMPASVLARTFCSPSSSRPTTSRARSS